MIWQDCIMHALNMAIFAVLSHQILNQTCLIVSFKKLYPTPLFPLSKSNTCPYLSCQLFFFVELVRVAFELSKSSLWLWNTIEINFSTNIFTSWEISINAQEEKNWGFKAIFKNVTNVSSQQLFGVWTLGPVSNFIVVHTVNSFIALFLNAIQ